MLTPRHYPAFKICQPCKRLFVNYKNPGSRYSIQDLIFELWGGYSYTRIRRDLEDSAIKGCEFCKAVISYDDKYKKYRDDDDDVAEQYLRHSRPEWFPSKDEELKFNISYDSYHNNLFLQGYDGMQWRGGDLTWKLYTTADDPASGLVHARAVLTDIGSKESLEIARGWLSECLTSHKECATSEPSDLPTRLIQVSKLGEPESARLCQTSGQQGNYCALSYCWGAPQPFCTTTERYSRYLRELPYPDLPRTVRDAFQVTRSLGLQYIWIDSLCIIQNDDNDKHKEIGKMLGIYMNAEVTISAASAATCNQGFLEGKLADDAFFLPLRVNEDTMGSVLITKYSCSWADVGAEMQPINERAWTLQEAALARRLLVFTGTNMIWRCRADYKPDVSSSSATTETEHWPSTLDTLGYTFVLPEQLRAEPQPLDDPPTDGSRFDTRLWADTWRMWRDLLRNYTGRDLTEKTDKLPAVSALAATFAPALRSEYLAGLWRRYLVHDLMWKAYPITADKLPLSGNPSWSWAAVDGEIEFVDSNNMYAAAEVVDCRVRLVSPDAPFGAVTSGELVIRGHLAELQLRKGGDLLDSEGRELPRDTMFVSDGDFETALGDSESTKAWCFTLGTSPKLAEGPSRKCHSIVLYDAADGSGRYRRRGYFESSGEEPPFWWEQGERVTVTII